MKYLGFRMSAFGLSATLGMLVGCSGGPQSGFGPPAALTPPAVPGAPATIPNTARPRLTPGRAAQLFARTVPNHLVPSVHPSHRRSWTEPDAKTHELLYASDINVGAVDIYNYKDPKKILGQITGFDFPYGECSDSAGHVFVVDLGAQDIVEFKHGATKPMRTLGDPGGYPIGCSVDPTTGNLAVSNFDSSGGIVVYQNGSGTPKSYADSDIAEYWSPGYDNVGNLYVEGRDASGNFKFAELAPGQVSFFDISLDYSMFFPGGVMWDGSYMALTDQEYGDYPDTGIYQVRINGLSGTGITAVEFADPCSAKQYTQIPQPWIENGLVVGGNLDCQSRFDYWNFTYGGYPVKNISPSIAPISGYGQTVSK